MLGQSGWEAASAGQVGNAFGVDRSSAISAGRDLATEMDRIQADDAVGGAHADHVSLETVGDVMVHPGIAGRGSTISGGCDR